MAHPKVRTRALGKGLSALLEGTEGPASLEKIYRVSVSDIHPDPEQPRQDMDEEGLQSLAESLKVYGVLQPLLLKAEGQMYRLVAGERRWRAAQLAGLEEVPARVIEGSEGALREMALVENVQRKDLSPIEIASALQALIRRHGLTQEDCASRLGWSRALVANRLRLLNLPESVRVMLADERITEGHARALLGLETEEEMLSWAERAAGGMSVRQLEAALREAAASGRVVEKAASKSTPIQLPRRFRNYSRHGVRIRMSRRGEAARIVLENLKGIGDEQLMSALEECLQRLYPEA